VLLALGLDEDTTHYAIRIGIGRFNNKKEIKFTLQKIVSTVDLLKKI